MVAAGGTRLTKLTFFADTPRALAVSPDGATVYAAAFHSGNQTTAVSAEAVRIVYGGVMPGPAAIQLGPLTIPQPPTGLIVKYVDGHWLDPYGTNFDAYVKVRLPSRLTRGASFLVPMGTSSSRYMPWMICSSVPGFSPGIG